jgi:DNA polymerase-4
VLKKGQTREREFLAPVAVRLLPGVGRETMRHLDDFGVRRIGDLSALGEERLRLLFGVAGGELWRRARGEFHEQVKASALHRMIAHEHAFAADTPDPVVLEAVSVLLAQKLAWDLRRHGVRCPWAELMLTYSDGATASRRVRLDYPSNQDRDLVGPVLDALAAVFQRRVRVRRIRLCAPFIPNSDAQFDFFEEEQQRRRSSFYRAVDRVRARHGFMALVAARALAADRGNGEVA